VTQVCHAGGTGEALCRGLNVPTRRLSVRNSGDLAAAWSLSCIIHACSAEVVHVH